jgi:hypothetical protein
MIISRRNASRILMPVILIPGFKNPGVKVI